MLGSLTPVLDRLRPLASDSCKCQKHKFFEGCVVRKDPLVLGDLTQLAVVALHGVGGVYYAPYVFGVLEVRAEPFPVVTPALDDYRIVLAPLQFQLIQSLFRRILVHRLVDLLQILHELLLPLAGHILYRVAYLVDYTQLHRGLGKDARYRIRETLQPVNARYEDVPDSSALEVGQDTQPEVRTLALGHVHPEQFLAAFRIECQNIIYGSGHRTVLLVHHLIMHRIKPYYGIDAFQRPALPCLDLRQHPVCDAADRLPRYPVPELLLQYVAYLPRAVPDGIQPYYPVRQ